MRKIVLILCLIWLPTFYCTTAFAFELGPEPPERGLYENPDETWTQWEVGSGAEKGKYVPYKNYSAGEYQKIENLEEGLNVDSGTSGQTAEIVHDITTRQVDYDAEMTNLLRTRREYLNPNEELVGDEVVDDAAADGIFPSITEIAGAMPYGAAIGAFAVGVGIGDGIDALVGLPTVTELFGGTGATEPESRVIGIVWSNQYSLSPHTECDYFRIEGFGAPEHGVCWEVNRKNTIFKETWQRVEYLPEMYEYKWVLHEIEHSNSRFGVAEGDEYERVICPEDDLCGTSEGTLLLYQSQYSLKLKAFPAPSYEASSEHHGELHGGSTLPKTEPLTVPVYPKEQKGYKPATEWIEHEREGDELPGLKEPHEVPIPNPINPEIPQIKPNEVYTEYKTELETNGFTNIEEHVLPETYIDPNTGPEGVVSVSPNPGTRAEPSTKVDVNVNPDNAPVPAEPPGGIPPVTPPGIHFPELHLLCTTMPFGVPCWLVKQLEAFSGASAPPVWSIGPISFSGHEIPEAKIHLSHLEGVMEVVRPFMVLFGTIGIVLLFYRIFTGKSIRGENPSGEVPDPEPWMDIGETSDEDQMRRWNEI